MYGSGRYSQQPSLLGSGHDLLYAPAAHYPYLAAAIGDIHVCRETRVGLQACLCVRVHKSRGAKEKH